MTGKLLEQENGTVSCKHLSLQPDNLFLFNTIDNGLGFIYSKEFPIQNNIGVVHLQPNLNVYVSFFRPEIYNFTEPFIIYQTTISNITMKKARCLRDYSKFGFNCILKFKKTSSVMMPNHRAFRPINLSSYNFLLKISFHSSGSVTDLREILDKDFVYADSVIMYSLYHSGYALIYLNYTKEGGCLIGGNIYDKDYKWYSPFIIPKNILLPNPCAIIEICNSSIFEMVFKITPNNFTTILIDIPKFINGKFYLFIIYTVKV